MGELVAQLYMELAQLFAGLFPEHFREAARTGPIWRRIVVAIFIGFGSLLLGLIVGGVVLAALFLIAAVAIGIVRAAI